MRESNGRRKGQGYVVGPGSGAELSVGNSLGQEHYIYIPGQGGDCSLPQGEDFQDIL